MDAGAIILSLVLLTIVVVFVTQPFRKQNRNQVIEGQEVSALLAERDRVLKEIQELDFDNSLGKVPAEDYSLQRQALLQQGVETLRNLDELYRSRAGHASLGTEFESLGLEEQLHNSSSQITDDDLEEMIARRRTSRREKMGGFCPKCGKPFLLTDKFCSCCGQPLGASS